MSRSRKPPINSKALVAALTKFCRENNLGFYRILPSMPDDPYLVHMGDSILEVPQIERTQVKIESVYTIGEVEPKMIFEEDYDPEATMEAYRDWLYDNYDLGESLDFSSWVIKDG